MESVGVMDLGSVSSFRSAGHDRFPFGSYVDVDEQLEIFSCDGCCDGFEGIMGSSRTLRLVLDRLLTVYPAICTVLTQGKTGMRNELIAGAIYIQSERRARPFVEVNRAVIPGDLPECEPFGHERDDLTGVVVQRMSRLQAADGGTPFPDEIGRMPLGPQAKLLRVVQDQGVERLSNTHTRRVDVREVAATNQGPAAMVAVKRFRRDLYYRLISE